jgi:hypothetical protein
VLFLADPRWASAHSIGIEAKLKGTMITVEVYYDDDTPAVDAKVAVEDSAKGVIAEGKTDAKGEWSFASPSPGKYIVRVDAGGGHAAKTSITIPKPATTLPSQGDGPDGKESPSLSTSDGPPRETFTGPMHWAMAGIGLATIAGLTTLLRQLLRARQH